MTSNGTKPADIYGRMVATVSRFGLLGNQARHREARQTLVMADLSAGRAVKAIFPFKWGQKTYNAGDDFLCDPSELGRVITLLQPGNYALQTQQEALNAEEWKKLKGIVQKIEPERATLQQYAAERSQARGELARAEKEVIYWRGELEAAEANLQTAEARVTEFLDKMGV